MTYNDKTFAVKALKVRKDVDLHATLLGVEQSFANKFVQLVDEIDELKAQLKQRDEQVTMLTERVDRMAAFLNKQKEK